MWRLKKNCQKQQRLCWVDLFACIAEHFFITEHVISEVTKCYPEQHVRLQNAIAEGLMIIIKVDHPEELKIFGELVKEQRDFSEIEEVM